MHPKGRLSFRHARSAASSHPAFSSIVTAIEWGRADAESCRRSSLYPRYDGALSGIYCRFRVGTGSAGRYRNGSGLAGCAASFATCLAQGLACRRIAGGGYWIARLHMEGEPARITAIFRPSAQSRIGTGATSLRGSVPYPLNVSLRNGIGAACNVVAAVWSRHHDRRCILCTDRPGDGRLLYVAGRTGGARSGSIGKSFSGRRVWRPAYRIRIPDREETRWLERFHRRASTASPRLESEGKCESALRLRTLRNYRNWIV